jgi:transcriptional regulator with XRE-family HTH domain
MFHIETNQKGVNTMKKRTWLVEKRGSLTQEQVAILSGISRSAYSNIENGRGLSVDVAKRIAKALKFDWKLFFADESFEMKHSKSA